MTPSDNELKFGVRIWDLRRELYLPLGPTCDVEWFRARPKEYRVESLPEPLDLSRVNSNGAWKERIDALVSPSVGFSRPTPPTQNRALSPGGLEPPNNLGALPPSTLSEELTV